MSLTRQFPSIEHSALFLQKKFKAADNVRMSKLYFWKKALYELFMKDFLQLTKLEKLSCGHMLLKILIKKQYRAEKVVKKKSDKLYVKWKDLIN